jgi:hypothetical protein
MAHIGTLEVEHESLVVLYDPQTGRVVHQHQVVTMKGGQHPDEKTMEKDAMEQLAHIQPGVTQKLSVLHVDPRTLKPEALHKVDTAKHVLVEAPRPPAKRKA